MRALITVAAVILSLVSAGSAQNRSVYTSTKTSACKTLESNPDEGGSYVGECRGAAGYKVHLIEGDIRQTIDVISPKGKKFPLDFTSYFGAFSYIGERLEWRLRSGKPVALIARYYVADVEGVQKSRSYLMVSKVGDPASCVTDIVDPGKGQNEKARKLADEAASKPCKPPR